MTAALAVTPASGSINALKDFVRIDLTGGDDINPVRIKAVKAGQDTLLSHEFVANHDGNHTWFNIMFPVAGSWTLTAYKTANDATVATLAVTVI